MKNNFIKNKEKRNLFLTTIVVALIVHFQLYSLMITGPDTLIGEMYHKATGEISLGRFGLYFVQMIKGNIVSPILSTILSGIFLAITVVLIIDILELKSKWSKYFVAVILAVAPNISVTLTFFYCSDAYMIAFFLGTLATYLIKKYENKKWIILVSGLCIAISMGLYQTYISITMVLCLAVLIIELLKKKEIKQIAKTAVKYICMGIVGIVLYYIISHLMLLIAHSTMSDYSGANQIGLQTLLTFPEHFPETYTSFINYFFNDKMLPNTVWRTNTLYIIIFITMLISLVYLIIKNKIYKNKIRLFLIITLLAIAPVCFSIIEMMVPDVNIHILMACSMILVFPIFFKILEMLSNNNVLKLLRNIVIICSAIIIWIYILQDQASYLALKSYQDQTRSAIERVVIQIESLDEYTKDMPVLFYGDIQKNAYFDKNNASIDAKKIYDKTWQFISTRPTIWRDNLDSWNTLLQMDIGVNIKTTSEKDNQEIIENEEFLNMKVYPSKESIKIIKGIVVVKLSD